MIKHGRHIVVVICLYQQSWGECFSYFWHSPKWCAMPPTLRFLKLLVGIEYLLISYNFKCYGMFELALPYDQTGKNTCSIHEKNPSNISTSLKHRFALHPTVVGFGWLRSRNRWGSKSPDGPFPLLLQLSEFLTWTWSLSSSIVFPWKCAVKMLM